MPSLAGVVRKTGVVVELVVAFAAGLFIAILTTPVGVSGAVFLLPVQLSVLGVPNPAVTPTNLLFNVVSGPGALLRHGRRGALTGPLTRLMVTGTLPGVVVGAVLRVYAVPGPHAFRIIVGAFLLPLGAWLCARTVKAQRAARRGPELAPRAITRLSFAVGVAGGIYGIGGGSILGPILVGRGMPVAVVAPAALASTFVTSIAGAAAYVVLALGAEGSIGPVWAIGLACGIGGLIGGYLGARWQPRVPERGLRILLGGLAMLVGVLYLAQSIG